MLRRSHSLIGLVLGLALAAIASTGAVLSVVPALDRLDTPSIERGTSVATLAAAVAQRHQSVSTLRLRPDGTLTAAFADGDAGGVERVDPKTGAGLGPFVVSPTLRFVTDLHRAFAGGDTGRIAAAIAAFAMFAVSITGLVLLARRLGGVRALLRPVRGGLAERLHGEVARAATIGLLVSSLTGLWMSASTFGLLPDGGAEPAAVAASGGRAAPIARLAGLAAVDVADLRELTFADPSDRTDVFRLVTADGETTVDPATGARLSFVPATTLDRVDEIVRTLHTGRGAWALGLLLGLSAASVPLLAVSGVLMWVRRRRGARGGRSASVPARSADTVILVGSDGGSTRGFAATLARALAGHGHRVHVGDMNDLCEDHMGCDRLFILAATWGDGGAPASAKHFLARLDRVAGRPPVAVLGFGDRTFPHFCGYAKAVSDALVAKGFPRLMGGKRIDRRSAQEFAQWGRDLGAVLGHDLVLEHVADRPETTALELLEREDYGIGGDTPVAILRFGAPAGRGRHGRLPAFEAGDLLGVLPEGETMPRFYSLASSTDDGVVEICVRRMPGGVCSTALHRLEPGDRIEAFVRTNPSFRPAQGSAPLILIGAGAGIGPLAGFVRANDGGRAIHLYWGGRSPASDFLYEHELARHLAERRLTSLTTAFSRVPSSGAYVQDRIAADAPRLRELIRHGAQILVCGSRDMSRGVGRSLDAVVRPLGIDLATLRAGGRYVEDVY